MPFVREVIPEEYWGMLKDLGLYNEYTYLDTWVADKEREIYFWNLSIGNRDDSSINDVLVWQGQVIFINSTIVDSSQRPIWNKEVTQLLKRGLVIEDINSITIPPALKGQEEAVIEVIKEVYHHIDDELDTEFRQIATPKVRIDEWP
ncbi:hypothetical protein [Streptococcus ferus]|uniref:hypothetical protein n=1 Tax=Streptococcus ferus TaxID=1345 RepID=UPI00359F8D13